MKREEALDAVLVEPAGCRIKSQVVYVSDDGVTYVQPTLESAGAFYHKPGENMYNIDTMRDFCPEVEWEEGRWRLLDGTFFQVIR